MTEREFWRFAWLVMRLGWLCDPWGWLGYRCAVQGLGMVLLSRYFNVRWTV